LGEGLTQQGQADIDVPLAGFDEPVGVEGEEAALGQFDVGRLEGEPAQSERGADGEIGRGRSTPDS
jgi:hypothetical protein